MNEFAVGDRVTYGGGGERLRIVELWLERFPAFREPQQVARLQGGSNDFTMRTAHLRRWEEQ